MLCNVQLFCTVILFVELYLSAIEIEQVIAYVKECVLIYECNLKDRFHMTVRWLCTSDIDIDIDNDDDDVNADIEHCQKVPAKKQQ